eukprot:IDg6717t1
MGSAVRGRPSDDFDRITKADMVPGYEEDLAKDFLPGERNDADKEKPANGLKDGDEDEKPYNKRRRVEVELMKDVAERVKIAELDVTQKEFPEKPRDIKSIAVYMLSDARRTDEAQVRMVDLDLIIRIFQTYEDKLEGMRVFVSDLVEIKN